MSEQKTTFIWHPDKLLDLKEYKATQVYGFCITKDKLVCLVRDKGEQRFTLPGGGIDDNEHPEDALKREFIEEAQFKVKNIKLLGSLEVIVEEDGKLTEKTQQVRYICEADEIVEFIPNKDGWETEQRIFVHYTDIPNYVKWINYPSGKEVFESLLKSILLAY